VKGEEKEIMPTDVHEKAAYFMRNGNTDHAIAIYRALANREPATPNALKS